MNVRNLKFIFSVSLVASVLAQGCGVAFNRELSGEPGAIRLSSATAAIPAGTLLQFDVAISDDFGNTVVDYTGKIHFTSNDPQADLPADSSLTRGKGTFRIRFNTPGSRSVSAIDLTTGRAVGSLTGVNVTPTYQEYLYAAVSTSDKIFAFGFSRASRSLVQLDAPYSPGGSPAGTGMRSVGIHPSGRFLYPGVDTNVAHKFFINQSTGRLVADPLSGNFQGVTGFAFTSDGGYLSRFFRNSTPQGIIRFRSIDPITGNGVSDFSVVALGSSDVSTSTVFRLGMDPTGKILYGSNLNSNTLVAYLLNSDGTLTSAYPSGFPNIGFNVRSIGFSPSGLFVYFFGPAGNLSTYRINGPPSLGQVTLVDTQTVSGSPQPNWQNIVVHPTGKFLYAISQSPDIVQGFNLNPQTGIPTLFSSAPLSITTNSLGIALDTNGDFLFTSGNTGVNVFSVNSQTGELTSASQYIAGSGNLFENLQYVRLVDRRMKSDIPTTGLILYLDAANAAQNTQAYPAGCPVSNQVWFDLSRNSFDAVLKNFSSCGANSGWDAQNPPALVMDGTSDFVEIPDDPLLDLTNNYSFIAWIKPKDSGTLFGKETLPGSDGYAFMIRNNNLKLQYCGNGGCETPSNANGVIELGTWQQVAVTFSNVANGIKFYRNGTRAGSVDASGVTVTNNVTLRLGAKSNGNNPFSGSYGAAMIYNRVLSANEIQNLCTLHMERYGIKSCGETP